MSKSKVLPSVMGFFHADGFVPAFKQATKFAGKGGRLGTVPDVIEARLATKPGEIPWETYFTTLSAEYYGFSRGGTRILIVANDVGPMSTLDDILKAYSWEYKEYKKREHDRRGGRISQEEFLNLESGKYGDVQIVDIEAYVKLYEHPFLQILRSSQCMTDPVLKARLGPRAEEYVQAHTTFAREWHLEQAGTDPENRYSLPDWQQYLNRREKQHLADGEKDSDPYILEASGANNCWYFNSLSGFRGPEEGRAFAHLLSVGGLSHMHHEGRESLVCDIGCHEWCDGVRLLGVRKGATLNNVHRGADVYELLRKYWRQLMRPTRGGVDLGMPHLVQIGEQWFTDYPKKGACMDNWEPEYRVTSMHNIGDPVVFQTTIGGYHGFFKYDVREVKAIAPPGASAYSFVDEPECIWVDGDPKFHKRTVQFHQVTVDTSQRLMRVSELRRNYELLMSLVVQEQG